MSDNAITVGTIADEFVRDYGNGVRYVTQAGKWRIYSGKHWPEDETNAVANMVAQTLRRIRLQAADERDDAKRKRLFSLGVGLDSAAGYAQVLATAATRPGVSISISDLNKDEHLINTPSCMVDWRTLETRPHDRSCMMTRICRAPYIAGASHPLWTSFLERVLPDPEVRAFAQRAMGYSLTGSAREECMFIGKGPTAGGKSSFADANREAAGDYAAVADIEAFISRPAGGGARNDIARLAERRLVFSLEVDEGAKLAQGLIKTLLGGDKITARFLYREAFEFVVRFVVWLMCNHFPRAPHDDDAFWRRVYTIPFDVSIPQGERDPSVKHRLRTDPDAQAAVLAWAIEGAMHWHQGGLRPPESVRAATAAYRREQDDLADFVEDYCVTGPGCWTASKDLRRAYEVYCRDSGIMRPLSPKMFWTRLGALGYEPAKRNHIRGWAGISAAESQDGDGRDRWDGYSTNFPNSEDTREVTEVSVPTVPRGPDQKTITGNNGEIPAGWTPEAWHRQLIRQADACQAINPEQAAEYRRQAAALGTEAAIW